jgi:hypothetical protein
MERRQCSPRRGDVILVGVLALLGLLLVPAAGGSSQTGTAECPSRGGAQIVQSIRTPGRPSFLHLDRDTLWVSISPRNALTQRAAIAAVDTRSGRIRRILRLPFGDVYQFVPAFGSLWVTGYSTQRAYQTVLRVDPSSGRVVAKIRSTHLLGSKIAATTDAVWINGADVYGKNPDEAGVRYVYKINPRTNSIVRRVRLPRTTVVDLLGQGRSLWASGWYGVVKLSSTGRVQFAQAFDGSGWSVAVTPGVVWVAQPWFGNRRDRSSQKPAHRLLRISVSGPRHVTVIEVGTQPGGVSAAAGDVWVAAAGGLARIDADHLPPKLVSVPVAARMMYHVAFAGGVWVALRSGRVAKIC